VHFTQIHVVKLYDYSVAKMLHRSYAFFLPHFTHGYAQSPDSVKKQTDLLSLWEMWTLAARFESHTQTVGKLPFCIYIVNSTYTMHITVYEYDNIGTNGAAV
jgi:hypothetical protein